MSSEAEIFPELWLLVGLATHFSLPPDLEVTEIPEFSSEVTEKSFGEPLGRPPCPFYVHFALGTTAKSYYLVLLDSHLSSPTPPRLSSLFSTLFSLSLSILSCSHITVVTLINRHDLLYHQRPGIFPFSAELSLLNQTMQASSPYPALLCALIMKDLGLWGDSAGKEESWEPGMSRDLRECKRGHRKVVSLLSYSSVHLLIPLQSFHAHAEDNNIHLSKRHPFEASLITGEVCMTCLFDAFVFNMNSLNPLIIVFFL